MALSANTTLDIRNDRGARFRSITIKTSSVIYKHALVVIDTSAGTALPAANATTTHFAGLAIESSTGLFPVTGNGTRTVKVATNLEVKIPFKTGVTTGNMGSAAYAADDSQSFDLTTLGPQIGTFVELDGTDSWVALGVGALAAAT